MPEHPYGWLSLLPPLLAIVLAIVTRRVILSLVVGVFVGSAVLTDFSPVETVVTACRDHLWPALIDPSKLHVFAFTLLMGAMVGVINRCGGMQGLIDAFAPLARTRTRGQFTVWLLGLFVFFDDYANTLLLGKTLQPLTDRLKISREKLAYLVDSTAAPVAGLALVSTWVATEIDYIQQGMVAASLSTDLSATSLFIASIPYRFYVLAALLFVPLVALSGRDFGPMRIAENRAAKGSPADSQSDLEFGPDDPTLPDAGTPSRWWNAVIPVLVTVAAVVYFLYQSGYEEGRSLRDIFGNADSYAALLWGALTGLLTVMILAWVQRLLPWNQIQRAAGLGALKMAPALVILWLAGALSALTANNANPSDAAAADQTAAVAANQEGWALWYLEQTPAGGWSTERKQEAVQALAERGLSRDQIQAAFAQANLPLEASQLDQLSIDSPADARAAVYPYAAYRLYTGEYLNELVGERVPVWIVPTLIFVLSSFIAFSTGTSWGTMALIMPLSIPLIVGRMTDSPVDLTGNEPLLLVVIGSVLAGAIFGDHCSPISDTTVLSSQSSGCHHMAHVNTQMPYALTVGAIVILLGTLPIGLGVPVWLCLALQVIAMLVVLRYLGRPLEA